MTGPLEDFWVHTVTAQPLTGHGAYGPALGAPVTLTCWVDEAIRLVRDGDGAQVVSTATIHAPAGTTALTVGGKVTLPSGREATVLTVAVHDSGALDLPDHVEAAVT